MPRGACKERPEILVQNQMVKNERNGKITSISGRSFVKIKFMLNYDANEN